MELTSYYNANIYGSGTRTVVLGHGFGTTQSAWQEQVKALTELGVRVVVFDYAGSSENTSTFFSPERHATLFGFTEDLIALMRQMEITGATFVGHSVSGIIGLLAANGAPDIFDSLVMIASAARYIDDPDAGYVGGYSRELVDAVSAAMQQDYVAWVHGFAPIAMGNPDRPHLAQEFSRSLLAVEPAIGAALLPTILRIDHRGDALRSRLKPLVLQTAADPAVPFTAAGWLAQATGASDLKIIDAEGHFPHLSAPAQVNEYLVDFIRNLNR